MQRLIGLMIVLVLGSLVIAETVSIKGSVKKTGGTAGIAGVKVSLVKIPNLTATTSADGAFLITGNTSPVLMQNRELAPPDFSIKGNTVVFSPAVQGVCGRIDLYSCDGKIFSSVKLDFSAGAPAAVLPNIGSGINFMKVTIGAGSFTRTLVRVGADIMAKTESPRVGPAGKFPLAKQWAAAAVDTLKAEKDGYLVKKVAIGKYTQENMAVSLDTAGGVNPGACSRAALEEIAVAYIAAQKAGDPSKMPLATGAKFIQNLKSTTADKFICKTAMPIDTSRIFVDVDSCLTFVEIISSTGTTPYVLMAWLKVANSQITQFNSIVTTTGDWLFNAADYLKNSRPQDWSILPDSLRSTRQVLINGANAYLDAFVPKTKSDTIPWGIPCERIEGGTSTGSGPKATCNVGVPDGVKITDRIYAVDVEKGVVDCFCAFGGGMPDSHMFRMLKGKYRYVHTLSVQN
jgi:hypothetical protein